MDSRGRATQQLRETLKDCFEQIRFARAADLARSRRYLEAEGMLSTIGRESLTVREIDLLARISAQQGQYQRARDLWQAALHRAPDNTEYKQAIESTREAEYLRAVCQKALMIVVVIAAILAACLNQIKQLSLIGRDGRRNFEVSPTGASQTVTKIIQEISPSIAPKLGNAGEEPPVPASQ